MRKLHQILLVTFLLVSAIAFGQGNAEGYEFATLYTYGGSNNGKSIVYVSLSNGENKFVNVDGLIPGKTASSDDAAMLKYAAQMTKDGWEVMGFQATIDKYYCFLKRKK